MNITVKLLVFILLHLQTTYSTEFNHHQKPFDSKTYMDRLFFNMTTTPSMTGHDPTDIVCHSDTHEAAITVVLCFILVMIAVATAGGNFLVILAVILVKKLQSPSNILIVSLAFSDFFVALLVLPFTIIDALKGYWPFNEVLCDMYISFDVLLCTSSILNLCAISIDRYLVITRPLTYAGRRTPCRMAGMIAAAWIGSALISIPPNFGWKPPFRPCVCEYSKDVMYQIYATFCAFYLPLIVMIVLYGRIFKLAREMSKISHQQMEPNHPIIQSGLQSDEQETKDRHYHHHSSELHQLTNDYTSQKRFPTAPDHLIGQCEESGNGVHSNSNNNSINNNNNNNNANRNRNREVHKMSSINSSRKLINNSVSNPNDYHPRRSKTNSDTKVIKTLGVIMGCFCLCWLPFFIVQLLRALMTACGYNTDNLIPVGVFRFLQWLGYVNSFLNPIIYAKFDREFRRPFKMILLCQCHNINARLRAAAFSAQYGLSTSNSRRTGTFMRSASGRTGRTSRFFSSFVSRRSGELPSRPRPPSHLHDSKFIAPAQQC